MKSLQEIKTEIANKYGFKTWGEYKLFWAQTRAHASKIEAAYDEVTERYAEQFIKRDTEADGIVFCGSCGAKK